MLLILAHALKCMACGKKMTEGNETIYTGICKHRDDLGESRECDQIGYESVSCMSAVFGKWFYNSWVVWFEKKYGDGVGLA